MTDTLQQAAREAARQTQRPPREYRIDGIADAVLAAIEPLIVQAERERIQREMMTRLKGRSGITFGGVLGELHEGESFDPRADRCVDGTGCEIACNLLTSDSFRRILSGIPQMRSAIVTISGADMLSVFHVEHPNSGPKMRKLRG